MSASAYRLLRSQWLALPPKDRLGCDWFKNHG